MFLQTTTIVYLKSQFEYLRGNLRKAIKVLNSAPQPIDSPGMALGSIYYNNLGVIHFYMRKHNLGSFYFRKAFQENERISKELAQAENSKYYQECKV